VPSKYPYIYENLLGNCLYQAFFDSTSLCHLDNAKNISKLTELQGQKAANFFNITFRRCSLGALGNKILKPCYKNLIEKTRAHFH
jgi:hypothetical protein